MTGALEPIPFFLCAFARDLPDELRLREDADEERDDADEERLRDALVLLPELLPPELLAFVADRGLLFEVLLLFEALEPFAL
jgi:hypothetical protein